MTVLDRIRSVDEATLNGDNPGCTLCMGATAPFVEALLPAHLIGVFGVGAIYVCPNCAEAFCSALGVVSNERFEATVERAQEAEALAEAGQQQAKTWAGKVRGLERQIANLETNAQVDAAHHAQAMRDLEASLADPQARGRATPRARIQAIADGDAPAGEPEANDAAGIPDTEEEA